MREDSEGHENNLQTQKQLICYKGFPTLQAGVIISIVSPAEIERGDLP